MSAAVEGNELAELASRFINNTGRHIFLTGKAGTGKTTFLKHIVRCTHKHTVIAAPTGIAAINAGGVTLHSLFQLPFGGFVPEWNSAYAMPETVKINTPQSLLQSLQMNGSRRRLLQELELLIIDEVSMLRADLLDAIDTVLRHVRRRNYAPFGGVQVLFIGDMLQLPPVVKDEEWRYLRAHYNTPYFFEAKALQSSLPVYIEFDKIYRQQDDVFIGLLNRLRNNELEQQDIQLLNQYHKPGFSPSPEDGYIYLTTHNARADSINSKALQALKTQSFFFDADIQGEFNEYAYPAEPRLELKKGAQVMFIKNDPSGEKLFFNGKIGIISSMNADSVTVSLDNGAESVLLEKYEWENIRYKLNEATNEVEEQVIGTFSQYPLRLAWAITVHKSQGLSFDKAILDVGNAFAPGQIYVALSRLTSLKGLVLSSPITSAGYMPDTAVTSYAVSQLSREQLPEVLDKEAFSFFREYLDRCFDFSMLEQKLEEHIGTYKTEGEGSLRYKHLPWATELKARLIPVVEVSRKFRQQLRNIFAQSQADYKQHVNARVVSAKDYFTPALKQFSKDILAQLDKLRPEKKVKTYLSELGELESHFYKQLQRISRAAAMAASAIEGEEYSKEKITDDTETQRRKREMEYVIIPDRSHSRKRGTSEKESVKKQPSKEISYDMYIAGKSMEDIALERGIAVSTVEGHLAQYVIEGLLEAEQFVSAEKIDMILQAAATLETPAAGALKQILPDDISYAAIHIALGRYRHQAQVR